MSFSNQSQKITCFTITSVNGAQRVIGRSGQNISQMRRDIGKGLYVRVEPTKTRRVTPDQLDADGYVKMTCANSNGDEFTVNIFVGKVPPTDEDGNILVQVKPVMVSAWTKAAVEHAIKKIDAITNQREVDLMATVSICPPDLIKHVIGARGSGLRRLERDIGDGCYIACSDGVFVIKANHKKSALRGKIVVEKKIKELIQSFQTQKKSVGASEIASKPGSTSFSIFAEDTDDEDEDVREDIDLCVGDMPKKTLSKSVIRRNRRKAAAAEKLAAKSIAEDPAVMFVSPPLKRETTGALKPSTSGWASDSTTSVDTVETTSDSTVSSPSLNGVWGSQTVTISESLEDSASRGEGFGSMPVVSLKKSSFSKPKVSLTPFTFDIMGDFATSSPESLILKREDPIAGSDTVDFLDMVDKFAVNTWDEDSEEE